MKTKNKHFSPSFLLFLLPNNSLVMKTDRPLSPLKPFVPTRDFPPVKNSNQNFWPIGKAAGTKRRTCIFLYKLANMHCPTARASSPSQSTIWIVCSAPYQINHFLVGTWISSSQWSTIWLLRASHKQPFMCLEPAQSTSFWFEPRPLKTTIEVLLCLLSTDHHYLLLRRFCDPPSTQTIRSVVVRFRFGA